MNVLICFNSNKLTIHKELLLTKFIEFVSYEGVQRYRELFHSVVEGFQSA